MKIIGRKHTFTQTDQQLLL